MLQNPCWLSCCLCLLACVPLRRCLSRGWSPRLSPAEAWRGSGSPPCPPPAHTQDRPTIRLYPLTGVVAALLQPNMQRRTINCGNKAASRLPYYHLPCICSCRCWAGAARIGATPTGTASGPTTAAARAGGTGLTTRTNDAAHPSNHELGQQAGVLPAAGRDMATRAASAAWRADDGT